MKRSPLVLSPNRARNRFSRDMRCSSILDQCFAPDFFPRKQDKRSFSPSEVPYELYVHERDWDSWNPDFLDYASPFRHEKYLDAMFWDESISNPRICILGDMGSGKSTLVDYYLRCHCPSSGEHREKFKHKLVLHFDARGLTDVAAMTRQFYRNCQEQVRAACNSSSPSFDIDAVMRARQYRAENVMMWVPYALEELSKPSAPFGYVVVVVDNLDNCSIAVQEKLIQEVEQWINSSQIRLWRVIYPLWPTTYQALQRSSVNILPGARAFKIGHVAKERLLDGRFEFLRARVGMDLDVPSDFVDYLDVILPVVKQRLGQAIRTISHGDIRAELSILRGVIGSEAAYAVWQRLLKEPARTHEYDLSCALLCEEYEQHIQKTNIVQNIFAMISSTSDWRSVLIGYHGIRAILTGNNTLNRWYKYLLQLAYEPEAISELEEALRAANGLHQTPSAAPYREDSYEWQVHSEVFQWYSEAILSPAYLDTMSQTTPLDERFRNRMKPTVSEKPAQFADRVETTLAFLDFLADAERQFVAHAEMTCSPTELQALNALRIKSYVHAAAQRYIERLRALSEFELIISADWWKRITNAFLTLTQSTSEFTEFRSRASQDLKGHHQRDDSRVHNKKSDSK